MKKLLIVFVFLLTHNLIFSQDVLMQDGTFNVSSGMFYDSGGPAAAYSSNENYTLTICPENAGEFIKLQFTTFSTQVNLDVMTVYDGDDTTGTIIDTFSGGGANSNPGTISASPTSPTGCLTITFTSNDTGNASGWGAIISTMQSCQTITPTIDSTDPVANTAGVIQIPVGTTVDFNGSATFSEDGTGATYSWNFGEGAMVTGQSVSHTYNNLGGPYTVTFTVSDTNPTGCSESVTLTVEILSPYIDVDQTTYTVEELVTDVLIDSPCAAVSNIISSTGTDFGSSNGIGYFSTNGGVFPFESGIILTTGNANNAEGPETFNQGAGSLNWPGDSDLQAIIPSLTSVNATYIQFDFVPLSNSISFDFLFASEEYGTFQCSFADGFAFILTDQTTGAVSNLALVPGTTDVVSVLTVRDEAYNPNCNSVNPEYFDSFYGAGASDPTTSPTNFLGHTTVMTASSNVTPNNQYTIKIAISDHSDTNYDSGVFLGAGSFNLGGELGEDITIQAQTAQCNGTPVTLDTQQPTAVHTWYLDGDIIVGETGSVIQVTQQGTYSVNIVYSDSCQATDSIYIEFLPNPVVEAVNNLIECDNGSGTVIFDLTENDAPVLGTQDASLFNITYHNSQDDANNDVSPIGTPTSYSGTDGETIFVRIEDVASGSGTCYATDSFMLQFSNIVISPAPDMEACDMFPNDGSAAFDLESQTAMLLGGLNANDHTVTYYTSLADATAGMSNLTSPYANGNNPEEIFVRIELNSNTDCFAVSSPAAFNLIVNPQDDAAFTMTPTCDGGTVDQPLATPGGTFAFNPTPTDSAQIDATTGTITTGTPSATYTVVYTTNGICPNTSTQNITVLDQDDPSFTMTPTCDGATATVTGTPGGTFALNPAPADSAVIDASTGTITNGTPSTTYTVEYTTNGVCPDSSSQTVTVLPEEDPSFTMTPTCDGATATVTGTSGGTFSFNPQPTDGAQIDSATGTVTEGLSEATYTVEYITNGPCPASSQQTFTVVTTPDSSFTMTSTCDGGIVDQPLTTPGGAFSFQTVPSPPDNASIDSVSGTVTGANPAGVYVIVYTVGTDCSSTSTFDLNVLPEDDSSFAMTPTCDGGTVTTPPAASGGQYVFDASSPVGNSGTIDPMTGTVTGALPEEQYVVSYTSAGTCPTTSIFNLQVYPLPVVVVPTPLEVCDDGTADGIVEMDLTVKNSEIAGGNPNYMVTYYEGLDGNGNPDPATEITTPEAYTNTNPYTQTLYVLVTDVNTTCTDTTTLDIVVEQAPETFAPDALEYCDPDNDCFGVFNLTDAELQITGGVSGLDVTFHETAIDAENNVNALSSPYNNIVACEQTVYVRVESATIATDCASFEELVLIVHPTPAIVDPTPFEICDDDTADGFATFDLRTKEAEILNGLDSALYTITYYLEEADANVPQNQIGSPSAFQNTDPYNQTVWVRVEDNTTGCFKVTSLELVVNALPVLVQPDPLTLCDYNNPGDEIEVFTLEDANAQILNGQTGITLTYYDTQANAEIGDGTGQLFSPYINSMNPETIYVRGENDVTGCWDFVILDLRVSPLPSPATPADYEVCDDDNDGFAEFDLSSQSTAIENGEPDITITYHETEADANSGENALPNNYINSVPNTQVIYVRAENTGATPGTGTGCYTIVELTLIVLPAPVIPVTLPDYVICDEDTDGYAQFDFDTVMDPQIYGSQDPADFILSYHTTQAAAETGNNPITNTSNYTNQTQWTEDIYIHLESIANGCVTTRMFTIRVVTAPEVNPNYDHTLTSCDNLDENYQEINDGFTSFNLTSENLEITNGEASWSVTYYETQADAEAGINAIDPATDYTNIEQGVQTIIAEVTDTDTGCSSFTTVTLQVLPNPSPSPDPENLELCDDNNSGDMIEIFDLTENEAYILNNEDGVTLSYYTSQDDAVMGTNAIADPTQHSNEDPDNLGTGITPQTIYVRVENTGTTGVPATGCYSLVNFDVIVNPLPVVPDSIEGLLHCEINNDGIYDDFGFDLESQTDLILNGQDATIFTVTYHENQMDADTGANALLSPYENIMNPQIIYVNVTNTETGCTISTLSFTIEVQEGALANQNLATYEICDDNMEFDGDTTNDMAEFDLSTQNALALDGQDPNNYTVSYYASQADADAGINSLPLLYTNSVNPQTIIVRVDNDTPGPIVNFDLSTVAPPGLDFDGDSVIDTYDTDNDNIFDFINVDGDDDGISDGYDYDNDGLIDAIDTDGDGIGDLVDIDGDGEVDNDTSICYETAELILQVNPMPAFNLEDSYLLCVNVNGTEVINVPVIATGLNASDYSFEWSLGGVVIPGETGPSITPTQGGEYSVVVTDVVTGCSTDPTDPNTITQVNESQPPTIHLEQSTLAFADQHTISVQVTNITPGNIGIYEFNIDGSEWVSNTPNDAMYLFENVEAGVHTIKARDINGCGETIEKITIMDYPHYFTPNGDGYNDTWNIYGLSNQLDAKIYIFDRFGKLIKQISPASAGWNGTYRGNLMPTNDYWFTVEYREPNAKADDPKKTFKAHFTLKR